PLPVEHRGRRRLGREGGRGQHRLSGGDAGRLRARLQAGRKMIGRLHAGPCHGLKLETFPTRYQRPSRFWYSSIHALVNRSVCPPPVSVACTPRASTCTITQPRLPSVEVATIGSTTSRYVSKRVSRR